MSEHRVNIVAEVLTSSPPMVTKQVAQAIIAALDTDARTRPFIGIVPPVRTDYPGWDQFQDDYGDMTVNTPEPSQDWRAVRDVAVAEFLERFTANHPEITPRETP